MFALFSWLVRHVAIAGWIEAVLAQRAAEQAAITKLEVADYGRYVAGRREVATCTAPEPSTVNPQIRQLIFD